MALSPTQRTRTAFEIAKLLPPEKLAEVSEKDKLSELEKVANTLAKNHTPSWIFYYIEEELDGDEVVGEYLLDMVDLDTILEELDKNLEDSVVIDLRNPASQNWMSDDPMEPFRGEFNSQKQSLENGLRKGLENALEETSSVEQISEDDVEEFVESISNNTAENVNYLRIHSTQKNGTDPARKILGDWMDFSLAEELISFLELPEDDEELLKEVTETIDLPLRTGMGY